MQLLRQLAILMQLFASESSSGSCQGVLLYALLHAGPNLALRRMPAWLARFCLHQRMPCLHLWLTQSDTKV